MPIQRLLSLLILVTFLSACAASQNQDSRPPERGNPEYLKVRDSMADEVYVDPAAVEGKDFNGVRKIYIAPANTAKTQIHQPPGVRKSDLDAWVMTPAEDELLQNTLLRVFTQELEVEQAFDVVDQRSDAELTLYSTVVALHPNQPRGAVSGAKVGGAITMSFALVDSGSGKVAVRALDSKSTDDIWAFDHLEGDVTATELILRSWGAQIRRSLMFLQGRIEDPLMMSPLQLKPQK
jgi:hypothetical protein